jgi:predicted metal-dependent HD superfamily phosphohydrolase
MSLYLNDLTELARKWQQCWRDLPIDSASQRLPQQTELDRVFQLLVTAYTQSDRHYHNLTHIHHVLTTIDSHAEWLLQGFSVTLKNPIAVSLAAWFHDFVYDPQASDNELQSAKAAGELLLNLGGNQELICCVQELILATQGHQIVAEDFDRSIFLDADLAILGADPVTYQAYSRSIRCEYSWVSDAAYRAGRIQVLESFLQRDRLYYTDTLFNELEDLARSNMLSEIQLCSSND